jgi:hypothetical protein
MAPGHRLEHLSPDQPESQRHEPSLKQIPLPEQTLLAPPGHCFEQSELVYPA